jgi:hypothetical protein
LQKICLLVLCVLSLSASARASVLWRGDYETGNLSQWEELEGLPERIGAVGSPVHQGRFAMRTELRHGDYAAGGCRNELVHSTLEGEGADRYYAWSTMFDANYPSNSSWQVFTQWHHTGPNGSPPLELDVNGERILLTSKGAVSLWSAPVERGVWHDFVLHIVWSGSSSTGLVELWYDGKKALGPLSLATLYSGQQVYLKQGLYRDANIQQTGVVFHDGMTIGTTLADVAPALAPPPLPPEADAGTPPSDRAAAADPRIPGISAGGCISAGGGTFVSLAGALAGIRRRRRTRS